MNRLLLTCALVLGLLQPLYADGPRIRITLADGGVVEGRLLDFGERVYQVQLDGGGAREVREDVVRRVEFLVEEVPQADGFVESRPRMDWSFAAPIQRVVGHIAEKAGRRIVLEVGVEGQVSLELSDQSWLGALQLAAGSVGAGVIEQDDGSLLVTRSAIEDPLVLVEAVAPLPTPPPLGAEAFPERFQAGLESLKYLQLPDGSWPGADDTAADAKATCWALLAFLGNGHSHRFGAHKRTVSKGLQWLKKQLDGRGHVVDDERFPVLTQSLATAALCEAYAVSRDFTLKRYAERAAAALVGLQSADGGWCLDPQLPISNSFSTAHAVLGLKAAKTSGLAVPPEAFQRAAAYLARATDQDGLTGFRAPGQGVSFGLEGQQPPPPGVPLFTACAALARVFCGAREALSLDPELLPYPHPELVEPAYWFFGTYALFQVGGEAWADWHSFMRGTLLSLQREGIAAPGSHEAGSWDPAGLWGTISGRVATTAVNLATLEIYQRYERAQRPR